MQADCVRVREAGGVTEEEPKKLTIWKKAF